MRQTTSILGITTCHLLKNPAGTWSFVGRIPVELCDDRDATLSDIQGQRWHKRADGTTGCYRSKIFQSQQDARDFARSVGVDVVLPN